MPKIYQNNNTKFLVYEVKDQESLVEANKFTGDKFRTYAESNQVLILTLRGWQVLEIGDLVVHVPASTDTPIEVHHRVPEVFESPGFLIFGPENFKKYFERVR